MSVVGRRSPSPPRDPRRIIVDPLRGVKHAGHTLRGPRRGAIFRPMNAHRLACVLLFLPLAGCAASWTAVDVYAPYDAPHVADAPVAVVRPVVTTRPDAPDTPWGRLATRFHVAVIAEADRPFVEADDADPRTLGWSEDSWARIDDVTDALLAHAPNPFPRGEHRLQEGTVAAAGDPVGQDGYVLLIAVQPSMKETLARLMGVAGEVTRFSGFAEHLDEWLGEADPDPTTRHDPIDLVPDPGAPETASEPATAADEGLAGDRTERRDVQIGKQNRVDVAYLLVDRRSGRFVAACSTRMEPVNGPMGGYRGSVRRALRSWRLVETPWTSELFTP